MTRFSGFLHRKKEGKVSVTVIDFPWLGGSITGYGADLLIVDDPIKNRAEAESQTYREMLWSEPEGSAAHRFHHSRLNIPPELGVGVCIYSEDQA